MKSAGAAHKQHTFKLKNAISLPWWNTNYDDCQRIMIPWSSIWQDHTRCWSWYHDHVYGTSCTHKGSHPYIQPPPDAYVPTLCLNYPSQYMLIQYMCLNYPSQYAHTIQYISLDYPYNILIQYTLQVLTQYATQYTRTICSY